MLINAASDNLHDPVAVLSAALARDGAAGEAITIRLLIREGFDPGLMADFLALVEEAEKEGGRIRLEVIDHAHLLQ